MWAGRSVWYDRYVGIVEAAGSNPAQSTTRELRRFEGTILTVIWKLKNRGYSERTLNGYSKRLHMLAKHLSLDEPERVKEFIASKENWSNAYKEAVVNAYIHYVRENGSHWVKPIYRRPQRLPSVPTTEQVNIIARSGRKYALAFSCVIRACVLLNFIGSR